MAGSLGGGGEARLAARVSVPLARRLLTPSPPPSPPATHPTNPIAGKLFIDADAERTRHDMIIFVLGEEGVGGGR